MKPVIYADGTVEYTLVDPVSQNRKPKSELNSWVFRFLDVVECIQPGQGLLCKESKQKRHPPKFLGKKNPNRTLQFYLNIEDYLLTKIDEPVNSSTSALVTILGIPRPLYKKRLNGKYNGQIEEYGFGVPVERDGCKISTEVAPNFFLLRHLKESELPDYLAKFPNGRMRCLRLSERGRQNAYRLINSSGYQVAKGTCQHTHFNSRSTSPLVCSITLWFPQGLTGLITFEAKHLKKFPEIYRSVVEFFNEATVVEKSENLNWKAN